MDEHRTFSDVVKNAQDALEEFKPLLYKTYDDTYEYSFFYERMYEVFHKENVTIKEFLCAIGNSIFDIYEESKALELNEIAEGTLKFLKKIDAKHNLTGNTITKIITFRFYDNNEKLIIQSLKCSSPDTIFV